MKQRLIFTDSPAPALASFITKVNPAGVFAITDSNVATLFNPGEMGIDRCIVIPAGEPSKSLSEVQNIWTQLVESGATRRSLIVNIGGGMITDIGGFAASTFKRGLRFVNIPTTILGAVDAAVGGKTGIDFLELKNEIGVFSTADAVIISPLWFDSLPQNEILSGYGEMLKHALLSGQETLNPLLSHAPGRIPPAGMLPLLQQSVAVKERIVSADPHEQGIRKTLNLGHTAGHAFESLAMQLRHPIPHGIAVAWGLVTDLVLSSMLHHFPGDDLHLFAQYVAANFPAPYFECSHYDRLISLMAHDKKNDRSGQINFTLLRAPGNPCTDCIVSPSDIRIALDITRDLLQ